MVKCRIMEGACQDNARVTDVTGSVSAENNLSVTWTWPRQKGLDYCFVFELDDDIPLELIIDRQIDPSIMRDEVGVKFSRVISKNRVIKVYAARIVNGCYEIVNQREGNCSQVFYSKVTLRWSVSYNKPFFGSKMTASLKINDVKKLNEDYILYRCKNGNRVGILYPIDLKRFSGGTYEINMAKNEVLELELTERQKNYITLVQNK